MVFILRLHDMKIHDTLHHLFKFFISWRGAGTTTLIDKIAKENDCIVLVGQDTERKGDNYITFQDLYNHSYRGRSHKPILVDNHVLLEIVEQAINELDSRAQIIKRRNDILQRI